MKKFMSFLVCIFTYSQFCIAQQHSVETNSITVTSLLKNSLPNYGTIFRLRNDQNKYASFSLAGSGFGSPLWIENEGPTTTFFNGNIQSMSLMSNNLGTQTGLVIGNPTLSTGVTIDAVQNLLPPIETGVVTGTYQGAPSDHAGVLGVNRLQTSSGVGVEGRGGKIGLLGESIVGNTGSQVYYGVYGASSTTGSGTAYAVYGDGDSYFDGDLTITGTLFNPSDKGLKLNIVKTEGSLDKLLSLGVYTYLYNTKEFDQMNLPSGQQIGPLAQEVKAVFPELTKTIVHKKYDGISSLEQIALESQIAMLRSSKNLATENLMAMKSLENTVDFPLVDENIASNEAYLLKLSGLEDKLIALLAAKSDTQKVEYLGVNYLGMIPHLLLGIQELHLENQSLRGRLNDLEERFLKLDLEFEEKK